MAEGNRMKGIGEVIADLQPAIERQVQSYRRRKEAFLAAGGRCVLCWDRGIVPGQVGPDNEPQTCEACPAGEQQRAAKAQRHAALLMQTSGASRFDLDLGTHPNRALVEAALAWCDRSWLAALARQVDAAAGGDDPFLLLHGAVGVGKSQIAAALLRRAIRKGATSARFVSTVRLLSMNRPGGDQVKGRELWTAAVSDQAVVLDDLGRTDPLTEYVERILFEVVDERYTARRWTILTTNRDPHNPDAYDEEALVHWLGVPVTSRILERATIINCGGPEQSLR